ncbi:hypothetical protein JHFBIEKO_2298 [Methylobacterium mesophilicum]|uniref:hypothetical protein n=1 Tax=Methylobacterium mesophilicum TaxID=39956 RepID=UPI001EE319D7|nr:hypothetical protein [Methylobacterium mesophilicum]GJE21849.1 hypothetical protein JHFBIEKO_2298 [Methylobacterium mesophilicum]
MSEGWHERVATEAGVKVAEVEAILARRRIRSRVGARAARKLRVTSVAFTGEKYGKATGRINFSWSQLDDGVWAVASDGTNFVGKSTVLEIMLWALRGDPKGLQQDVQKWLDHVRVEFKLDDGPYAVDFDVTKKVPSGTLSRERPDGSVEQLDSFETHQGFAAAMSRFMMEALDLDPIPYQQGKDEAAQIVHHGWKALSSGLYFWGEHEFLLGDSQWGGLPARILQLYVGLPWASTVMQASTAQKDLNAENLRTKAVQRAATVSATKARTKIIEDLSKAQKRLSQLASYADFAQQIEDLAATVVKVSTVYSELELRLSDAENEARHLQEAADGDEREARGIRETFVATNFFNGLQPTCCPRCEAAVTKDRIRREEIEFSCSVCSEPISAVKMEDVNERLLAAEESAAATSVASKRASAVVMELRQGVKTERERMLKARADLGAAPASSNLRSRRDVELEISSLEGQLKAHAENEEEPDETADRAVVNAAYTIAKMEMDKAAGQLFSDLANEVLLLARRFGLASLEWVKIDAQAHMTLGKGGETTAFNNVTLGERLRLRIATAIALLRIGERLGVGRHPGLLIIDSPGAQETADINLEAFLKELRAIADNEVGLQVFVSSAKSSEIIAFLDPNNCRVAAKEDYLW